MIDVQSVIVTLLAIVFTGILCALSYSKGQVDLYRDIDNHGCEHVMTLHKSEKV